MSDSSAPATRESVVDDPVTTDIWAVVSNWRNSEATFGCVDALLACNYPDLTVLIVAVGSGDGNEVPSERFPECTFLRTDENLGSAGGNAAGMLYAVERGAFAVLVVDQHYIAEPGFLEPLVAGMQSYDEVGAVGPVQLARDNLAEAESVLEDAPDRAVAFDDRRAAAAPVAPYVLLSAEAIRNVGPFDPRLFWHSEIADWCMRAADSGWKIVPSGGHSAGEVAPAATHDMELASAYFMYRNECWVARRHGTWLHGTTNSLRVLLWHAPRTLLGNLFRGTPAVGMAALRGYLVGVFGDCRRGTEPGEAAAERIYELAD